MPGYSRESLDFQANVMANECRAITCFIWSMHTASLIVPHSLSRHNHFFEFESVLESVKKECCIT